MFFDEWYKKNIDSFGNKSTKEKMLEAHNYGFEEGVRMGKESVPAETRVSQPSEPLPCPFCGGEALLSGTKYTGNGRHILTAKDEECNTWIIFCKNKCASLGTFFNRSEAIKKWNTRLNF